MKVKHTFDSNTIDEDKHIKEQNLRIRTKKKSNEEAISLMWDISPTAKSY